MRTTKILGYLGLLAAVLVGLGEYFLHYSPNVLEYGKNYEFFKFVPTKNLTIGHFLAVIGLPFYFAGYLHIYRMLRSGSENLARAVLAIGFVAFAVGGIWIGSRVTIGTLIQQQANLSPDTFQVLVDTYTTHHEVLVKALRIVIALLSVVFIVAILRGDTYYRKWMAFFNPIVILIFTFTTIFIAPSIGKHLAPIAMNVTHFILFGVSLYHLSLVERAS